jgi:hypothetical protein
MKVSKKNPRADDEVRRPGRGRTWITEFERVFIAGTAGMRGEEMAAGRRRR